MEKDKLVWKITKDGFYSVKSNLDVLEERGNRGCLFPKKTVLEPASSPYKSRFFCVRSLVVQDNDIGSAQETGFLPR